MSTDYGGYAYVAISDGGISIIDVDPLAEAKVVSTFSENGSVHKFAISGNFIYTADPENGMKIIDVSDPLNPALIKSVDGNYYGVDAADGFAYLASGGSGLTIVDVDPPQEADAIKTVPTCIGGFAVDVKVLGGYAYLATGKNNPESEILGPTGVEIINLTPLDQATVFQTISTTGNLAYKIVLFEGYAYVWTGNNAVEVIRITDPTNAVVLTIFNGWALDKRIATFGNYMFALQFVDGLKITALPSE